MAAGGAGDRRALGDSPGCGCSSLYAFVASVLPVWLLLQPRDYLNSHQLVTGLVVALGSGSWSLQPTIVAPAVNLHPAKARRRMIPVLVRHHCVRGDLGVSRPGVLGDDVEAS